MKKTVASNKPKLAAQMSIIVAPRLYPNPQFDRFIQSTSLIKTDYEIIVVASLKPKENISEDSLQPILAINPHCSRATIIALDEDLGLAQARNIGAAVAESGNLIFSDDDITLTQDITPLIQQLGNYHSAQPLILRYSDHNTVDSAGDQIVRLNGIYHAVIRGAGQKLGQLSFRLIPEKLPSLRGAFFAIKKEVLFDVGGLMAAWFSTLRRWIFVGA